MRCLVSDRHFDQTFTKLVGLHGWQVVVKVRGTHLNYQSGLYPEDGLVVNMGCRKLRSMERVGWWQGKGRHCCPPSTTGASKLRHPMEFSVVMIEISVSTLSSGEATSHA